MSLCLSVCQHIVSGFLCVMISGLSGALDTVNVVIFAGGKFRENVGKTFHVGVIFTIFLIFPS